MQKRARQECFHGQGLVPQDSEGECHSGSATKPPELASQTALQLVLAATQLPYAYTAIGTGKTLESGKAPDIRPHSRKMTLVLKVAQLQNHHFRPREIKLGKPRDPQAFPRAPPANGTLGSI